MKTPKRVAKSIENLVLFATTLALVSACTPAPKATPENQMNSDFLQGLFSTRPTIEEPYIFILKLSTPSLLEASTFENGKPQIDLEQHRAILAEQEETIKNLQKISAKIRILIRYKLVLNALAIWAPADTLELIKTLPNVSLSEKSGIFARPEAILSYETRGLVGENTSVKFIGSEEAYAQNIRGQNMKVGVIDTGVDYTHKMFGGEGTVEAYKAIDPNQAHSAFPNKKVVGGIDLVGTHYNSGSPDPLFRIPTPDLNPLDEATHGTHVAGTVAGLGDGINTYDGVAPAADIYAIKVFGAEGSTSDEVVIAALEYAADPDGDLSFNNQLDVVNLSLGSNYGNPHIMYNHAIKNLVRGGTLVVASGGNSGDLSYIVGAPGVVDEAISVGASIDNMNHNTFFSAAQFTALGENFLSEAIEGSNSKPLAEVTQAKGNLVDIGLADTDLDAETVQALNGQVAFAVRGVVAFTDKIKRAQDAGAIAIVVANNAPGEAFIMGGGNEKFTIPAVMINQDMGNKIKKLLGATTVSVDLKTLEQVHKPWLVDTISPFSSRGPRSIDGLIKPELTAPGTNIVSASAGKGDKGNAASGTSMSGPHIAGVMALLKQKHPSLSPLELKSVLLSQSKIIHDENNKNYSVSRQGAGRVQVAKSLNAKIVTLPATLSLGLTDVETSKVLSQKLVVKNISGETQTLNAEWAGHPALTISAEAVVLAPGEQKTILISATVNAKKMSAQKEQELDGYLRFTANSETMAQLPALAVVRKISIITGSDLQVRSSSKADAAGSLTQLTLKNSSSQSGKAYLFNLLGTDSRKTETKPDLAHNKQCDLQSAGYRLIEKEGAQFIQFGFKLYEGMTTWHRCEVNVQIDSNGDNIADQEIAGLHGTLLPGYGAEAFVSILLDANKSREIRKLYEGLLTTDPAQAGENYQPALIDLRPLTIFDNSSLAIVETPVSALALANTGELRIKISTTHQDGGAVEYDDYLSKKTESWMKISTQGSGQAFSQLPESIEVAPHSTQKVQFTKGYGSEKLVLYAPENRAVRDAVLKDDQSQVLKEKYQVDDAL